jgi:ApbE superfamily uncharacterized protein (UPF0280 family)
MAAEVLRRQFRLKETFATVIAGERYLDLAARTLAAARAVIESYIAGRPRFRIALEPLAVERKAPPLIRRMAAAAALAGVGPMASVAGAIAQVTVEALRAAGAGHVIVDNGGDIVLFIDRPVTIGIFTGPASIRDIALRCEPRAGIFSVCTSSGTVGHSLSFGRADAATVVAGDGFVCDAVATALGNRVREQTATAIQAAIRASLLPEVEGLLVAAGKHLGMGGKLPEIVRTRVDAQRVSKG